MRILALWIPYFMLWVLFQALSNFNNPRVIPRTRELRFSHTHDTLQYHRCPTRSLHCWYSTRVPHVLPQGSGICHPRPPGFHGETTWGSGVPSGRPESMRRKGHRLSWPSDSLRILPQSRFFCTPYLRNDTKNRNAMFRCIIAHDIDTHARILLSCSYISYRLISYRLFNHIL